MNGNTDFKRLNYFQGLFTTAQEWIDEQNYHLEKRKLQSRVLHRPGVAGGLQVEPHPDGGLHVLVKPGVALDNEGNLIYLPGNEKVKVDPSGDGGKQVYVRIEFDQQDVAYFANVQDPEYSGYTRKVEHPKLTANRQEPSGKELMLARITLPADATAIAAADIDCSHIDTIGVIDKNRDEDLVAVRERMRRLHEYHLDKQKRHNRGLHTTGVLHGIPDWRNRLTEFTVLPHAGLTVDVGAGAALDHDGNEIYLDTPCPLPLTAPASGTKRFYVAVRYDDHFEDYLTHLDQPFCGSYCTAQLAVITDEPTNSPWLALARIDLTADAVEIREPADPANPQPNEIDRRVRSFSGAIGLVPARLEPATQAQLTQAMQTTRQHFSVLAGRFPVPALEDVRYGALHLQMSAATIEPDQLRGALRALAAVEQSGEHELGEVYYPALPAEEEFIAYQAALAALNQALSDNQQPVEDVLDRQEAVAEAAITLAKVVFPPPTADAGDDRTVQTTGDEVDITLDAGGSKPGIGRKIVKYRWEKV